ncbi:MAG: hypothetical protein N2Z63_01475, partial [Thiobacillaceae bacterium]|nr:hypothetical protein [Thiobacillaceae bacterium]
MSPHDPRLWATAGAALLWLVIAWLQARARQALPRPRGTVRVYALGSGLWFTAVAVVLLGPIAGLIVLWLIPFEPDSRLTAAALLGLYAGVSGAVGLTLLCLEVRSDDHGLIAPDLWGVPAFLPWLRVRSVQLRFESLCFLGGGRRLYVPVMLNAWPQFLAELEQRLPQLALPPELTRSRSLREDPERAAQESQLQGLYDHAERIAAGALLAVGVSLAWVEPHPTALAWAALGGLGLAAYPLARPWLPAKPGWLGELIG